MTIRSLFLVVVACLGLSACDAVRSSDADGLPLSEEKLDGRNPIIAAPMLESRYTVGSVDVEVPETLVVSEANLFYPQADVVWRGDPPGDRLAQIKVILEKGLAQGTATLLQGPKVDLTIKLERFHALTEKARFSVGGVHDIVFLLTVTDSKTKAVLEGPRRVEMAIKAAGSDRAIAEDAAGRTQTVVIVEGVAEAIRRELSIAPPPPPKRGFFAGFR